MDNNKIFKIIAAHEGFSGVVYKCPRGFNTIGYGFNLDADGIPYEVANYWLKLLIGKICKQLDMYIPWWTELDEARRIVLIDMAYNMGIHGLLKFKKMLKALGDGEYKKAAKEMKDSRWYGQVHNRANYLISVMNTGEL